MGSGTASAASAHWVADLHYKAHNHDQIEVQRYWRDVVVSVNQGVPFICPGVCALLVGCFTREGCGSLQAMRYRPTVPRSSKSYRSAGRNSVMMPDLL